MEYCIIGGSAAGVYAAEAIREIDKISKVTLISDEKTPLYSRCLLTYLLAGAIKEDALRFKKTTFYAENSIDAMHGVRATKIDAKRREVALDDGKTVRYDRLLIATGARPKAVDIPGAEKEGVFTVRTIEDARGIERRLEQTETAAVLGGGLIGLRDVYALHGRGKKAVVIVKSPQLLSQVLDKEAADIILRRFEENGVKVLFGHDAKEIVGKKDVEGVLLDDGTTIACQIIIEGKGVNPNIEIAKDAGIKVQNGIVADEHLRTSVQDIYTAGDCAECMDIARDEPWVNALWPCAAQQGRVAGQNMAGKDVRYEGSLAMNSVEFFGCPTISVGITKPKQEGFEVLTKAGATHYRKVILRNGRIVGLVLLGDITNAGVYHTLISKKVDVTAIKPYLVEDTFDYGKILPLVKRESAKFGSREFRDTVMTYE